MTFRIFVQIGNVGQFVEVIDFAIVFSQNNLQFKTTTLIFQCLEALSLTFLLLL